MPCAARAQGHLLPPLPPFSPRFHRLCTMLPLWLALSLGPSEPAVAEGDGRGSCPGPGAGAAEAAPWLGAWALRFTPHVTGGPAVWLLEVSSTLRLWGGLPALLAQMQAAWPPGAGTGLASGPTALAALARWRLGDAWGQVWSDAAAQPNHQLLLSLPLHTLDAARPHLPVLGRLGVHTWGQLRRLPRAGVARRWGRGLLQALDQALGQAPEAHTWLAPTPEFDMALEWPHHLESAQALMAPAQQLLAGLHGWLMHRQRGVLAWRWTWAHDPRRNVASHGGFDLHVAQPTQNLAHLKRLSAEHLARQTLAAPAVSLRLTTLAHAPCWPDSADWLRAPADTAGHPTLSWTELLERLSARLGNDAVSLLAPASDHRPEHMQQSQRGQSGQAVMARWAVLPPIGPATLLPTWLLSPPQPLRLSGHNPCYQGELQLLAGPQRLEVTHWPDLNSTLCAATPDTLAAAHTPQAGAPATLRDYFVARSPRAGLLWVYREHLGADEDDAPARLPSQWFLHGVFA